MNLDAGCQIRSEPPRARDAGTMGSGGARATGATSPAGRGCARPRRGGLRKTDSAGASERASARAAAGERAGCGERAWRPRRPAGHAAAGAHQDCVRWRGERAAAAHGERGAQEQESQKQHTDSSVSAGFSGDLEMG